jgi:hypothetical protein
MKKTIAWLWSVLFLGGLLGAQTLDEILAKNYQARGGLDKLKAMAAAKFSGTLLVPAQGLEMPVTVWEKYPATIRIENTFQDKVIVRAYDGRKAWWIMPFLAPDAMEMPREQAERLAEQADFEDPLVAYKEKGFKLELVGREELEGIAVFKLRLTKAGGREIFFYLDEKSGMELKSTMILRSGASEAMNEIIFSDYKPVNGLQMPFAIENKTDGKTVARLTVAIIEINPLIDEAIFLMPEKKVAAVVPGQK